MQTASESMLVEKGGLIARLRPPIVDSESRMVLMVHGWTGDERSMWVFARSMPENCWLVAPRAPHALEPGGYSWVQSPRGLDSPFDDYRASVNRLVEWVDRFDEIPAEIRRQFFLVGFSQGAAVSFTLALTHPHRIIRLAGLSGFMPPGAELTAADRPLEGKICLVAHGIEDQRVPIGYARQAVQILEMAGADVHYCEDRVGHKTSAACFKRLQAFLQSP